MHTGEILIYQNQEGNIKIDVRLEEETVWLTQAQIALLFGKGRTTITEHIQNVFIEGELEQNRKLSEIPTSSKKKVQEKLNGKSNITTSM